MSTNECYKHQAMVVKDSRGNISSMVTHNGNEGTHDCPWRIQAPEGKKTTLNYLVFVLVNVLCACNIRAKI